MNCDSFIKANIERNCVEPMAQGLEREAYIINRAHIDFANVEFVEGSTNQISALPLKKGTQAFSIFQDGTQPFASTTKTVEVSTALGGTVTTAFHFIVRDNGPKVCEQIIDPMLDGEFVIIWQNKYKGLRDETAPGAAAYEIAGFFQGLTISEGSREMYSDDTGGGWAITLQETKAPRSAMFLNAGSLTATEELIKTLLAGSESA